MKQKLWCCILVGSRNTKFMLDTLFYTKKGSIKKLLNSATPGTKFATWDFWRRNGWQCMKVDVNIQEIKKEQNEQ